MADLITIETYKQAKAIASSKDDERLGILIPSVSQLVKTYCANSFIDYVTAQKTEYITIEWTTNRVQLTESPIIAVATVSQRTTTTEDYEELTVLEDYAVNARADTIDKVSGNWPEGVEAVKVVYTAGYATLPADLTLVLIDLIAYYFKEEYKTIRTLSGASMHNTNTSSLVGNLGFPDHIKRVLDMYKQI